MKTINSHLRNLTTKRIRYEGLERERLYWTILKCVSPSIDEYTIASSLLELMQLTYDDYAIDIWKCHWSSIVVLGKGICGK